MKINRSTLKNGIKVVIVEMPDRGVVATSVYIGAGGRYENSNEYGISHFLEHVLFCGTKKYSSRTAIANLIESVGGTANASTGLERTRYFNIMPKSHKLTGFDILSEQISSSLLDLDEIEKVKEEIIQEINSKYDDPKVYKWLEFRRLSWPSHPIGSNIIGSKEKVQEFKKEDLVSYMKSHYVANNMAISVAGDVKSKEVIKELDNYFGKIKKGKKILPNKIENNQKKSRVSICTHKIDQAQIVLGYKSLSLYDKRRFALDVLMAILCRGAGSIIYKEIRAKRGLAYSIGGDTEYYIDGGFSYVGTGINKDKIVEALKIIKKELFQSKENLFSREEIKRAKEILKGQEAIRLDETLETSLEYGRIELLDPLKLGPKERAKMIDGVTAEGIREVAKEVFQDKNENLVVIGPYRNSEKFKKALKEY